MVFSSVTFLLYFLPAFILLLQFTPRAYKNYFILASSILFYSWGAPSFIWVVLATTLIDFVLVHRIHQSQNKLQRKLFLCISVAINLGLLFWFKYAGFFAENLSELLKLGGGEPITMMKVILPVGISFYTFETITYVVDVYRRVHKPLDSFTDYLLYILLFPKLIAGPIVRFHTIADQITQRDETTNDKLQGIIRFCIGLGKKVLIANVIGKQADLILGADAATWTSAEVWTAMVAYTFQIYYDFSGYSDMALGLGRIMGFKFPENFNHPYNSGSITEFWRRWHISLGAWMKNYLYIPLGGNKVSHRRMLLNLWLVFVVSGLWHGASWNFVIWGIFHGGFLILDRIFLLRLLDRAGKWPAAVFTFFIVLIGWVFFRTDDLHQAIQCLHKMFWFEGHGIPENWYNHEFIYTLIIASVGAFMGLTNSGLSFSETMYNGLAKSKQKVLLVFCAVFIWVLSLSALTSADFNPFIYFRF